jgi:hypothetical protein
MINRYFRTGCLLVCLGLFASACAGGFPPTRVIALDPGQNGPFAPPAAGPDWYGFELDSFESVTIYSRRSVTAFEGVEPAATLLNSDGEVLATAEDNAPNEQFRIEKNLPAGTYFLRVEAPLFLDRDEDAMSYEIFLE